MERQTNRNSRSIRIFVSSTFRDMVQECDDLMTHAWPELRRFCRERQVELVEVDLRWGMATSASTKAENAADTSTCGRRPQVRH